MSAEKKVLVIGSGPIIIGQAAEFDYSGTQACKALKESGCEVVLINSNPATIMTDPMTADHVYIEAMTHEKVAAIIEREKPTYLLANVGGQTALNLALELDASGVLEKNGVEMLGTSLETIRDGEDRERFKQKMKQLNEPLPISTTVETIGELEEFLSVHGVPVVIRPAFTLGGTGGGIAQTRKDAIRMTKLGLAASPINQCLIEMSIAGYKEVEYEVMRDAYGTSIIVCNMENIDPVGVHTGDSVVFAPAQTLSDRMSQILRTASRTIVSELGVIGGCNIQFAVHPTEEAYYVIEVNPRVSRSSALASKATGYPIAKIATRLALGERLDECINPVTSETMASFEPALDYVTAKVPCFPFDLFDSSDRTLGTQMKATGESMAMGKTLEEALQKAWRGAGIEQSPLYPAWMKEAAIATLFEEVNKPTDRRLLAMLALLDRKMIGEDELQRMTRISPLFVNSLKKLSSISQAITLESSSLLFAKRHGFTDEQIAMLTGRDEHEVRAIRGEFGIKPVYQMIDTCAGEFESTTPYFYGTWSGRTETVPSKNKKVAVIGAGPIRIGQGIEFDYCSVHAVRSLQALGYEAIMINNNPETVSTDFEVADKLYVEPLTKEEVIHVLEAENCSDVLIQFGGQTGIALAHMLEERGFRLLGTKADVVDEMEDRDRFYRFLDQLEIARIKGEEVDSETALYESIAEIGYPCIVRPSYVIGGKGMHILHDADELATQKGRFVYPLLVDAYVAGVELEVDCVSDGNTVYVPLVMEQVEQAGVHSGDSTMILPPVKASRAVQDEIEQVAKRIGKSLDYRGAFNIQFVLSEGKLHVLEINPRASRTLPIVSKVTGRPLLDWSVKAALGMTLETIVPKEREELDYHAVKTPVFSTLKLEGVDPKTGPVMRSTGETLQWTLGEPVMERFAWDATTDRAMKTRSLILMGEGTEGWGGTFEDARKFENGMEFNETFAFFSCIPQEAVVRENALKAGALVITEEKLAEYLYGALNQRRESGIHPLAYWQKRGVKVT
ncbi:carbamoyl-phosphate synthase (glutamine-hydrolyzing) large subunit [Exiguobacterium flavidum]|uniref:carbamoyl-phosphate synthase (glutamine-hydrolyzing) large subunit n=1 Tax=Exiguobacterium flavidum TaxID=2184695 RepID=UPI000DF80069|nr:carbamoyl-phosphate synthase (glutamine-hydrolyzing) large subunit [Exiguobacterium flavidum]